MHYQLVALFSSLYGVRAWFTSPNQVGGGVCETWNGLPGNCVPLDSNGHNHDCNNVHGYLLTDMCGENVLP